MKAGFCVVMKGMLAMFLIITGISMPAFAVEPKSAHIETGTKQAVFVLGLSGSHQFKSYFAQATKRFHEILQDNGYVSEKMALFSEKPEATSGWGRNDVSSKENLKQYFEQLKANPIDELFLFVAVHANGRDEEAMMHLPGDDMSYGELIAAINQLPVRQLVAVIAAPQSGIWIQKLSHKDRVVIAGNGYRQYDFIPMAFLRIFPATFDKMRRDSKEKISLRDVFWEAQKQVRMWYQRNNLQCTEMALIDANADGKGDSLFPQVLIDEWDDKGKQEVKAEKTETPVTLDLAFNDASPDAQFSGKFLFNVQGGNKS